MLSETFSYSGLVKDWIWIPSVGLSEILNPRNMEET